MALLGVFSSMKSCKSVCMINSSVQIHYCNANISTHGKEATIFAGKLHELSNFVNLYLALGTKSGFSFFVLYDVRDRSSLMNQCKRNNVFQ